MAINRKKAEKQLAKWEEKLNRATSVVLAIRAYLDAETDEEKAVKEARITTAETAANEDISEEE